MRTCREQAYLLLDEAMVRGWTTLVGDCSKWGQGTKSNLPTTLLPLGKYEMKSKDNLNTNEKD